MILAGERFVYLHRARRINTATACRRCAKNEHHQYNCPNLQVLPCWICDGRGGRPINCCQQGDNRDVHHQRGDPNRSREERASQSPQRATLADRSTVKQRPSPTQPNQRNHPTSTLYNETYDIPKQRPSFSPKLISGNPFLSEAVLEPPLRSIKKQSPQIHRNLRLPADEARMDMNAPSEPTTSRSQRSQRRHASYSTQHLVESVSPAAYETSHSDRVQRVNLVKSDPTAASRDQE
ncbi:uncharacterized protein ACN427_013554 [Glossina fuscipes fuscipes]